MSLLGLDIGTTGCKAVAFSVEGELIASAYREYPLYSPQPGWQELDPEEVWHHIASAIQEVAAQTAADPVQALGISAQGEACHAVDRSGQCLSRSPVTFDARTAEAPAWWLERKNRVDLAQVTGMPLHGMYSINKIRWFKEKTPDIYSKAWKFLCYEDFAQARLGLDPVMSDSLAARTMAYGVHEREWSQEILDIAGIDRDKLAGTAPGGTPIGEIASDKAAALGLPRGVVVATGGHDQPMGALGTGVVRSGEAVYATGTVDCICPIFTDWTITQETVDNNLCCYPSALPGLWASIAFNFTGGSLLKWYRDNLAVAEREAAARTGRDVYELICESVPEIPEKLVVLPHFTMTGTPNFDTESRGLIAGLTLNTPREELASAILSGVTYEMKLNLDLLESAGAKIARLRVSGGGAKSAVWNQRKADIMGRPVAVMTTTEAPAFAAALLAGQAAGIVPSVTAVLEERVRPVREFEPDPTRRAAYAERFEIYRQIYPAMRELNHRLARLR